MKEEGKFVWDSGRPLSSDLEKHWFASEYLQEPNNRDRYGDPENCVTVEMWDLGPFMSDQNCDKSSSHVDLVCQKRP